MSDPEDDLDERSRLSRLPIGNADLVTLSFPARARRLPPGATPAEREIAELVYLGHSNADICRLRETSEHTLANQLAALYRKARVVSRVELVAWMAGPTGRP